MRPRIGSAGGYDGRMLLRHIHILFAITLVAGDPTRPFFNPWHASLTARRCGHPLRRHLSTRSSFPWGPLALFGGVSFTLRAEKCMDVSNNNEILARVWGCRWHLVVC